MANANGYTKSRYLNSGMSSWVALVAPAEREVNNDGIQKGRRREKKTRVRGDHARQKIWPRREMGRRSDREKGTKLMGKNKGYPRRIEVLSLRERDGSYFQSDTRKQLPRRLG